MSYQFSTRRNRAATLRAWTDLSGQPLIRATTLAVTLSSRFCRGPSCKGIPVLVLFRELLDSAAAQFPSDSFAQYQLCLAATKAIWHRVYPFSFCRPWLGDFSYRSPFDGSLFTKVTLEHGLSGTIPCPAVHAPQLVICLTTGPGKLMYQSPGYAGPITVCARDAILSQSIGDEFFISDTPYDVTFLRFTLSLAPLDKALLPQIPSPFAVEADASDEDIDELSRRTRDSHISGEGEGRADAAVEAGLDGGAAGVENDVAEQAVEAVSLPGPDGGQGTGRVEQPVVTSELQVQQNPAEHTGEGAEPQAGRIPGAGAKEKGGNAIGPTSAASGSQAHRVGSVEPEEPGAILDDIVAAPDGNIPQTDTTQLEPKKRSGSGRPREHQAPSETESKSGPSIKRVRKAKSATPLRTPSPPPSRKLRSFRRGSTATANTGPATSASGDATLHSATAGSRGMAGGEVVAGRDSAADLVPKVEEAGPNVRAPMPPAGG